MNSLIKHGLAWIRSGMSEIKVTQRLRATCKVVKEDRLISTLRKMEDAEISHYYKIKQINLNQGEVHLACSRS